MVVFCADKKVVQQLTRRLGGPAAKYYDSGDKGAFQGASWYLHRESRLKLIGKIGSLEKKVQILK